MKKLWGIRHTRYWWKSFWLMIYINQCRSMGFGFYPSESDVQYLKNVWEGKQ